MKTVALVVTYNRMELLSKCLEALQKQSVQNMDICIVNNASTDNTESMLAPLIEKKKILYYNTGENLGGAGGFQYGIKKLVKLNYKYIWIMDDDTLPKEDALEKLLIAGEQLTCSFGFLASSVLYEDGTFCQMNNPGISKNTLLEFGYNNMKKGICSVEYASFVSILIPTDVVKKVGFPIKEFFIWNDDYEYTTRISALYPSYYVANSEVIHKIKNNMLPNVATDSEERIDRYFYEYRNGYYVARRRGVKEKLFYFYKIFKMIKSIITSSENYKMRRIKVVIRGFLAGIVFRPVIEQM